MPTLGVAHWVFDHWTISFGRSGITLNISTNIYVSTKQDEEVFFGEHPALNLMAWGRDDFLKMY